jgi:hypothetical protein
MNDVNAVAVAQCPTAAANGNYNGIVHGSGPWDNYRPRDNYIGKNLYPFSAPLWLKSLFAFDRWSRSSSPV